MSVITPLRIAALVATAIIGAGAEPSRADVRDQLRWSGGLGWAGQGIGDGVGGGLDLPMTVGLSPAPHVTIEAITEGVLRVDGGEPAYTRLHLFAGAGLRLDVWRVHVSVGLGLDKVWTWSDSPGDAHARVLSALRVAIGADAHVRRGLRLGIEAGVFGAPLLDDVPAPDIPDERIAAGLRLVATGR